MQEDPGLIPARVVIFMEARISLLSDNGLQSLFLYQLCNLLIFDVSGVL